LLSSHYCPTAAAVTAAAVTAAVVLFLHPFPLRARPGTTQPLMESWSTSEVTCRAEQQNDSLVPQVNSPKLDGMDGSHRMVAPMLSVTV